MHTFLTDQQKRIRIFLIFFALYSFFAAIVLLWLDQLIVSGIAKMDWLPIQLIQWLTNLGQSEFMGSVWLGSLLILLCIGYLSKNHKWIKPRELVFCGSILFGITVTVVYTLKFFIGRPRPMFFLENGAVALAPFRFLEGYTSMPSGHTNAFMVSAAILSFYLPYPRCIILLAALLSCTRILLLCHYPSDVLITWAISALLVAICFPWIQGWSRKLFNR